jgi:hypothetical protein
VTIEGDFFFPIPLVAIYQRSGTSWSEQGDPLSISLSGCSVVGAGCALTSMALDGDTLAAAAIATVPNYVTGASSTIGEVFLFERSGGVWTGQTNAPPVPKGNNSFGSSLALSGNTLAVGDIGFQGFEGGDSNLAAVYNVAPTEVLALQGPPSGFGLVPVGTTVQGLVQVSNAGTEPVTIAGANLTGANPGEFTIAGYQCTSATLTLQPGDSCTVTINFTPSIGYYRTASFNIAAEVPLGYEQLILTGIGVPPSYVSPASPAALDFGAGPLYFPIYSNVLITNFGSGAVTLQPATVAGPNGADFVVYQNSCPQIIAAGLSCFVSIEFTPTQVGWELATLTLPNNSPYGTVLVPLFGVGQLAGVDPTAN